MRPRITTALAAFLLAVALPLSPPLEGQDVELLGRVHGTRPPDAYFERMDRDPGAFEFRRAWKGRILPAGAPEGSVGTAGLVAGSDLQAVRGTVEVPLILGLFSDSPQTPPYERGRIQEEFFTGPNSRYQTVTEFYREISGGRVELVGTTFPWRRVELTAAQVAGGSAGLGGSARVGEFIVQILSRLDDGSVDWGRFDNDGPDGVPNSGDDDGFVDVLSVMHPTSGAECTGDREADRIWSHRFSISAWLGSSYTTRAPSASGGFVRVDDYTIQPVRSCEGSTINEIGVYSHELGHGFGLPDLYDTNTADGSHGAVGRWGLMAQGSWGCGSFDPARPCHMGAWSKAVLGWVDVEPVDVDGEQGTLTLDAVETGGRILRLDSRDGSGEYLLLENRQPLGSDVGLLEPGLLVWHVDPAVLEARAPSNRVNADPDRMGVWIRQADGLNELGQVGGGTGDAGDPFPGSSGNTVFHAGSNPGAWSHLGGAMGVTLLDITLEGETVALRLNTGYRSLALRALGTEADAEVFTVDGEPVVGADVTVPAAPFQERTVEALAGVELGPGIRTGFQAWSDTAPRVRSFVGGMADSALTASYGGREYRLALTPEGPVEGVTPGSFRMTPQREGGWYADGARVSVEAEARTGFAFREWIGELAGQPATAEVTLDGPVTGGAAFDLTYATSPPQDQVELEAAREAEIAFQARNANLPVTWRVTGGLLPAGLRFRETGVVEGAALQTGGFTVVVKGTDAIGLEATTELNILVTEARMGAEVLTAPFLLATGGPDPLQRDYLDRSGNGNGIYDLGDFRAFVQRNPELPMAAALDPGVQRIVVPLGEPGSDPEGGR